MRVHFNSTFKNIFPVCIMGIMAKYFASPKVNFPENFRNNYLTLTFFSTAFYSEINIVYNLEVKIFFILIDRVRDS